MGINTKGVIITPVKDVMHVMNMTEKAIDSFINDKGGTRFRFQRPEGYQSAETRLSARDGMAITKFAIPGEERSLTVHFNCDFDEGDIPGEQRLIFSMGCHGSSDEIIKRVLDKLTHLGPCFFKHADSDDAPFEEVKTPARTFIQAVLDYDESASNFFQWVRVFRAGKSSQLCSDFLGITAEELDACLKNSDAVFQVRDRYKAAHKSALAAQALATQAGTGIA